jgi:hypothetical protein
VKAVYRFSGAVESLEETIHQRELQNRRRCGRDGCKFYVAISLHGLFQAAQQHMDSSTVEVPYLGTVEHHPRPICVQNRLDLTKK